MLGEEQVKNFLPFGERAIAPLVLSWSILSTAVFVVIAIIFFFLKIDVIFLVFLGGIYVFFLAAAYAYCNAYLGMLLFELRDGYLFVRKGVITPGYTMIPYENVQDVHLDQPVLEKALGLCNVTIYTATFSARGSEMIPGLSRADAQVLKDSLFKKMKEAKNVVD